MSNLSGLCPNCGSKLIYESNDPSVMCYACDSLINVEDFATSKSNANTNVGGGVVSTVAAAAMVGFDNPESGVVFIENFFDTYNWDEYQMDAEIDIPEISSVINNNKMKNGAIAASWYLDYKGRAVPVRKKMEGLGVIAEKIGEAYNPDDLTEAYESYDLYVNVSKKLLEEKEEIFKRLDTAIKYAEKFKLEKAKLTEIKADIEELKAMYERDVLSTNDISEVPTYLAAQAARNVTKSRELAMLGIDAKSVYEDALQMYNSENPDKSGALVMLERVRGYGESVKLINNINKYLNVKDELYQCFGQYFIFKREEYSSTLDVKALGKKKQEKEKKVDEPSTMAWALYKVVDGVPAKKPAIKGIDQIISCYGGGLYYFKAKKGIYRYDVYKETEEAIELASEKEKSGCSGKKNSPTSLDYYKNENGKYTYGESKLGKTFYVARKLQKQQSNSTKKNAQDEGPLNAYSLMLVDMEKRSIKQVVPEFKEIVNVYGNHLFYKYVKKSDPVKSGCLGSAKKEEEKVILMVCDLVTGETKPVLDEDCEMYTVYENKVVYAHWKPNAYNKDLYAYDIATGENVLIETNIYKFFDVIVGKIYYLVGNKEYSPLVRNSFAGDAREEIMQNVEKIIGDIGGWLYVLKGKAKDKNSALVKVSADGKKRIVLCTQLKKFIRFYGTVCYYIDYQDALHSVRIDGRENRRIAEKVRTVFPTDNYLYYAREELVSGDETALSIYKMDKDGRNVRKVVFNIDYVQNENDINKLYFIKTERFVRFKAYRPKKEKEATYIFRDLTRYYVMDKTTEETQLVLTTGLPEAQEKTGCGGKKKAKPDMIYEECPIALSYSHQEIEIDDLCLDNSASAQKGASGCSIAKK